MSMRVKFGILILSSVIALYAIVGGLLPRYGVIASNDPYSQMTIFHEVLTRIVEDYVDEPDLERVRLGLLRGLAEGLDPYSAYLTPDQVRRYQSTDIAGPAEAGMVLSKVAGYVYVVSITKGGPAEAGGIRAGDVFEYINNRATRDMSLYDSLEMVRGPAGKEVELRLFRGGRSETVKLKLQEVKLVDPVGRLLSPGMGYLQVASLASGQAAKVKAQVQSLVDQGAKSLALDLRGTADGDFDQGVAVANLFIGKGTLAKLVGKEGKEFRTAEAQPGRRLFKGSLVALVDRTTAGAAEIVAAAILDNKAGDVVGERSFGAGGDQELFRLRDGGGILMTTKKYAAPSGKPFMGTTSATSGIMPNVEVRRSEGSELPTPEELEEEGIPPADQTAPPQPTKPSEDLQLKKAIELLRQAKS
jgi:carboxyl-terminal processing protease